MICSLAASIVFVTARLLGAISTTMSVMNASYASPVADAAFAKINAIAPEGFVQRILAGANAWTVVLTLLIGAVLYDQGE